MLISNKTWKMLTIEMVVQDIKSKCLKYSKQFKVTDLQILTSAFSLADVPFDKNKPFYV